MNTKKLKKFWKRLKKYFRKLVMQLISAAEYQIHRSRVRVTMQIRVIKTIMKENSKWFKLIYISPVFNSNIILKIEKFGGTDILARMSL